MFLFFSVVGVLVILAEMFEVGVAVDFIHAIDHLVREAGKLSARQRRYDGEDRAR